MTRRGFPHSDIPGSKLVCSSPRLFAAYRVLHRLLAPRHSPYALSSLTIGMQELTIDAPSAIEALVDSPSSTPSLRNTACVLWITEKTTVCRIFSCQRTLVELRPSDTSRSRSRPLPHSARSRSSRVRSRARSLRAASADSNSSRSLRSGWLANRSRERSERSAKVGGEYRARTGDLLVANQALSQLS